MLRRIMWLVLCFSMVVELKAWATDSLDARLVGATFKTLAKGYVATVNLEKLKQDKIARIRIMKEDWYKAKYREVYRVIKELPPGLKEKYAVTENMPKSRAISDIRMMDKKKLYEIINNIPDRVILETFNEAQQHEPKKGEGDGVQAKISRIWDKALIALSKGGASTKNAVLKTQN